jgi:hypothetical protein
MLNIGNNNLLNIKLENTYDNKYLNEFDNSQSLIENINNKNLNNFPNRGNKSGHLFIDNFKNNINQANQNNKFLNKYNNLGVNNMKNNFIRNSTEQSRFSNLFDKSNIYNYNNYKNKFNDNNINFAPYSSFNTEYEYKNNIFLDNPYNNTDNLNQYIFPYNLNEFNNSVNNYINNRKNNPKEIVNLKNEYINKKININKNINIIKNSPKKSLTSLLCNKEGISQIKILLNNNSYNTDLIRKIILSLKEENGLHLIFENIYGNYFIQDLFPKMNNDLIELTIDLISSEFVNIAKTPSGTHCLQKLLNYINNGEMEISIIKAIRYREKEMAFDEYATYVLQKIISIIPDTKRIRLNNLIIENFKELALNSNSVFILKKFISTNTIKENKNKIINVIKKYFLVISQSPYGNYVIQYLFEAWPMKECEIIINEIIDKSINIATQRYSANIILKALEFLDNPYKQRLIYTLCFSSNILDLLNNKYSYYTINKAVIFMDNSTKNKFVNYLSQNMKNLSYKDKNLVNKIISLIKK